MAASTLSRPGSALVERMKRCRPPSSLLALAATIAGWPFLSTSPPGSLDDGYYYVLSQWLLGRVGGRAVVLPYGPLGTLNVPFSWSRPLLGVQMAFAGVVLCSLAWLIIRRLRRALPWALASVLAGLVVVTAVVSGLVEPAVLVTVLLALEVWEGHLSSRTIVPVLSAGVIVLLLIKPSSAAPAVLTVALVALTEASSRRAGLKRLAVVTLVTAMGTPLLWVALGVPLAQLPAWLRGMVEYNSGYDVAAAEEARRAWEYGAAAVLSVVVLALAARPRPQRAATVLITATVLYVDAKHGFVRHDAHSVAFFSAALVLLLALLRPEHRRIRVALIPALAALLVAAHGAVAGVQRPLSGARQLAHQAAVVIDGARWEAQRRQDDADLRDRFQVPQVMLDRIGSSQVDIQPWEDAAALAYDLAVAPVPVVQPYLSFTGWLDELAARSLTQPTAAPYVLRRTTLGSLDGRFPLADSAAYQVELVCRYREVLREGTWQLLELSTDRCGPARRLGTVVVRPGQPVEVPAAAPDSLVTARVTPAYGLGFRLRALLFKTTHPPQLVLDGAEHRFLWTAPGGPIPVRAPERLALLDPLPGGRPDVDVLELRGVPGDVVLQFEERSVGP